MGIQCRESAVAWWILGTYGTKYQEMLKEKPGTIVSEF